MSNRGTSEARMGGELLKTALNIRLLALMLLPKSATAPSLLRLGVGGAQLPPIVFELRMHIEGPPFPTVVPQLERSNLLELDVVVTYIYKY